MDILTKDVLIDVNLVNRIPEASLERAIQARREGRYADALNELVQHKCLREDHSGLITAALCCEDLGRTRERDDLYELTEIALRTHLAVLYADWAQSIGRDGDLGKAKEKAEQAIGYAPNLVVAYQNWLCAATLLDGPDVAAKEALQRFTHLPQLLKVERFTNRLAHDSLLKELMPILLKRAEVALDTKTPRKDES